MNSRGFTLLEVLVAMAIFAIIGLGAQQMLQTVIRAHEQTQEKSDAFVQLTRGINRIQRDFMQVVPRPVRDEYGELLPPLMAGGTGPYPIELTRAGWNNPLGRKRSRLQRVAYELVDGEIRRHFWLVLDRAEDSQPITQTLFEDVDDFRVNFIDQEGEQTDVWPPFDSQATLPVAAEVIVASRRHGELRRLITLPVDAVQMRGQESEDAADGEDGTESGADEG